MKNGVLWDVTPCGSCKNRRLLYLVYQVVFLHSLRRLLVAASVVPSSPILVTLMKEALRSSQTSVLTRVTRRNIPEGGVLPSSFILSVTRLSELDSVPSSGGTYKDKPKG
jgi:hypothetical protein